MDKRSIEEAAFDAMLREAAKEALPLWLAQMENEYPPAETPPISPGLDRSIRRMVNADGRPRRRRSTRRAVLRFVAVLILLMALAFGTVMSVEAWRVEFLNLFIDWGEESARIAADSTEPSGNNINFNGVQYAPTYLPEGFEMSKATKLNNGDRIEYTSSDGGRIIFDWSRMSGTAIEIDTEHRTMENIMINEQPAFLFIGEDAKEYYNNLIWNDGQLVFSLDGTVDTDELIRVAESVQKII